jgi:hypothetical protein
LTVRPERTYERFAGRGWRRSTLDSLLRSEIVLGLQVLIFVVDMVAGFFELSPVPVRLRPVSAVSDKVLPLIQSGRYQP